MVNKFKNWIGKLPLIGWILRHKFLSAVLIIIIAVVGFVVFRPKAASTVSTAKIERGTVKQELVLTGAVDATKYASLSFPTSGKIAWVGVAEGQTVKKGQALIALDKTVLAAAYQEALNTRRNTVANVNDIHNQLKDHENDETFSQVATRVAAESVNDSAWDAVKAAKYNLDNSTLYAPFDGLISSLPFDSPGVNVSLADTQVVIVDPSTIYFNVDADQSDVTSLKIGQDVTMVLDSYQDRVMQGKVSFISFTPTIGASGTNYKVSVTLTGNGFTDLTPRIGMTGDAKFILSQKENVLFAPAEYVKSDIKGKYLKVGSEKNKTYIETGLENEETIEIMGDKVKEGDTIYD